MFKTLCNRAALHLEIEPVTPFLIKAGDSGTLDVSLPDMQFVRTHSAHGPVVYVPGSSLKGVIRSQTERLLRTAGKDVCDIFNTGSGCRRPGGPLVYNDQCPVCRTFGSTGLASRVRFTDLLPWAPDMEEQERVQALGRVRTEARQGVAINRRSQAARGGLLFEMEVVAAGTFYGEVEMTNFQLWQLALVGWALRDLDQGYLHLGSAKSRGLGRVRCRVNDAVVEQYGPLARVAAKEGRTGGGSSDAGTPPASSDLRGVGDLDGDSRKALQLTGHDLLGGDRLAASEWLSREDTPLACRFRLRKPEAWTGLVDALLASPAWSALENWNPKSGGTGPSPGEGPK